MAGGWIKIHRGILRHWVFADSSVFYLWTNLLMRANWKEGKFWPGGASAPVTVARGQLITGRNALHAALYPKRDADGRIIKRETKPPHATTLWRWMSAMEKDGMIALDVRKGYTIVTICNYDLYQDNDEDDAQASAPETRKACASGAQEVRTIEEIQEIPLSLAAPKNLGRFDTPEVRAALSDWARFYPSRHDGDPFTDLMRDNLLMDRARLGWDADKLTRSIRASIGAGSGHVFDADEPPPWARQARATGNGARKPEPDYPAIPPRRART